MKAFKTIYDIIKALQMVILGLSLAAAFSSKP